FTQHDSGKLKVILAEHDFGVTTIDGQGSKGPVKILLTIVKRKDIALIRDLIKQHQPEAFYSIEDIRTVSKGVFPRSGDGKLEHLKKVFPFGGGK
ncbi:MAG TPA: DUF2179 domain-containing protein, partial [Leptospiraceae bacterium]|nr:DUF2179 domain-containing protein [Leptospiraceae bacterium]